MAGNRWARVDVSYFANPKVRAVSTPARLLHLSSILHCVDQLTDGDIDSPSVRLLGDRVDIGRNWQQRRADELTDAGLWLPTGNGYRLHDFERMNPQAMRKIVERDRERWRHRQQQHRQGGDS